MLKITASTPSNRCTWAMRCIGATLLLLTTVPPAVADDTTVYRVGIVPQFDSRTIHDIWTPILAQLQTRTGLRFVLVGSANIPVFEKKFEQQEFDFAYMNPYHAVMAASHYVPLVRDVVTQLQGIIVVRNDSPIQKLSDLQGKNMDFPAPNALAASLMPRAKLNEAGITVQARYVKTHTAVYLNVALGQTDAGGGVQQTLEEQPIQVREKLRVIDRTIAVASHPLMASRRISQDVREKVRAAMLALGETADGRAMLSRIPMDKVGLTTPAYYEALKQMGLHKVYVPN